jgi:hypothetical protein
MNTAPELKAVKSNISFRWSGRTASNGPAIKVEIINAIHAAVRNRGD